MWMSWMGDAHMSWCNGGLLVMKKSLFSPLSREAIDAKIQKLGMKFTKEGDVLVRLMKKT